MTTRQVPPLPLFEVIAFRGPQTRAFLQRMLSNDLERLGDGQAVPAFLLDVNGRIVSGGVFVATEADDVLALAPGGWGRPLMEGLALYRLADQVEWAASALEARLVVGDGHGTAVPWQVVPRGDGLQVTWPMASADDAVIIGQDDVRSTAIDATDFHCRRIAAGRPQIGLDVRPGTIPLEANLYDWLSHTKGCYVGQEVVERMWSRGRRARHLVRLRAAGAQPPEIEDRSLEVTSAVVCGDEWHGLGYLRGQRLARQEHRIIDGVRVTIEPIGNLEEGSQ